MSRFCDETLRVWRLGIGRRSVFLMKVLPVIVSASLCGCALHGSTTVPEPARGPARDSLFHFDESRTDSVAARGFVAGTIPLLGDNVVYLRAGAPVAFGLAATRALLSAGDNPAATRLFWQPLGGGVSGDLLAAYTFGIAVRVAPAVTPQFGRYIAFWVRQRNGPWRITAYTEVNGPVTAVPREPAARNSDGDVAPAEGRSPASAAVAEERSRVRAADSSFSDLSYRMGVAYAFANTVAPDGVVFGDPQLVIGPRAIQDYLGARAGQSSLVWQPLLAYVAASRDLGFTIGESTSTGLGASGAAVQRMGKYLTVWKRQSDGTWKFVVDGGNPGPPRGDER
jgi:ketosteroid isomerase-like protein